MSPYTKVLNHVIVLWLEGMLERGCIMTFRLPG